MDDPIPRAYCRKAGHACGMNKKENTFVNLGQFEDEVFFYVFNLQFIVQLFYVNSKVTSSVLLMLRPILSAFCRFMRLLSHDSFV